MIPIRITISSIERGERNLEMLIVPKEFQFHKEFLKGGILIIEPLHLSIENDGQSLMSQTIGISLVHKTTYQIKDRKKKAILINKKSFASSIAIHQKNECK